MFHLHLMKTIGKTIRRYAVWDESCTFRHPKVDRPYGTLHNWKAYVLGFVLFPTFLLAEEIREPFIGVRPIGMGGAFTAIANDQNAVWTNPAGVGRITKARSRNQIHSLSAPNILVGANSQGKNFYKDFKTTKSLNQKDEAGEIIAKAIQRNDPQKPVWARSAISPIVYFEISKNKPMALGLYSDSSIKAHLSSDDPNTSVVESVIDTGSVFTIGLENFSHRFNIGMQIRAINRYAYEDRLSVDKLASAASIKKELIDASTNTLSGLAFDLGMLYTLADYWFPTIGIAAFNLPLGCHSNFLNPYTETKQTICGTLFSGTVKNKESLYLVDPLDIRAGISITPRLTQKIALRFALDLHHGYFSDGSNNYGLPGIDGLRQLHGGVELYFGNPLSLYPFSLRVGANQGLVTTGATLRFAHIVFEVATYHTDLSTNQKPDADQRSVLSFSVEF